MPNAKFISSLFSRKIYFKSNLFQIKLFTKHINFMKTNVYLKKVYKTFKIKYIAV